MTEEQSKSNLDEQSNTLQEATENLRARSLLAEFCQVSNLAEKDLDFAHALIYIEDKGHIDETVLGLYIKGKYDKQVARRLYARMFISFIESVVFELKSEALDRKTKLSQAERALLEDKAFELSDKGEAVERPYYGSIERNLKFAFRCYAKAFDISYSPDYSDNGWHAFQQAVKIRNRITHPKLIAHMNISDDDQNLVDKAHDWFIKSYRALQTDCIEKLEKMIAGLNEQQTTTE